MSEREQVWRELIESQPWSGQTVAEWCEGAPGTLVIAQLIRCTAWMSFRLRSSPQDHRRVQSSTSSVETETPNLQRFRFSVAD